MKTLPIVDAPAGAACCAPLTRAPLDVAALAANPDHKPLASGWIADRVLKVVRKSPSAGVAVAYRLIVEGS